MELDEFKSTWQDGFTIPATTEKNMTEIVQMVEQNRDRIMGAQQTRLLRMTVGMVGMPIVVFVLFYVMSEGFTNEADPVSSLLINMMVFVPMMLFFGSRYWRIRTFPVENADARTQLVHTIKLLKRQQLGEMALIALVVLLGIGGVVAMMLTTTVAWLPMGAGLMVAAVIGVKTWQDYQGKLRELERYLAQLAE